MLVLTRYVNESVIIAGDITVTVIGVRPDGQVRLGITAPADVPINRHEIHERIIREGGRRDPGKGAG